MRYASILLLALMCFAAVAVAADLNGKWEGKINAMGQDMTIAFVFKVDGETLTGSVESEMGSMAISNGKINGDDFTFNVDVNGMPIAHKGKINGDAVTIKTEGEMAMEFTLKRVPNK